MKDNLISSNTCRLEKQYWFKCQCVACQENWPTMHEMTQDVLNFRSVNSKVQTGHSHQSSEGVTCVETPPPSTPAPTCPA